MSDMRKAGTPWARRALALAFFALAVVALFFNTKREALAIQSPTYRSLEILESAIVSKAGPDRLDASARDLARTDPLQATSFFLKALAMQTRNPNDLDAILPLMEEARRRQPRFVVPRVWLVGDLLRRQRPIDALTEADRAMRISANYRDLLYPLLIQMLPDPKAGPELIRIAGTFPNWRQGFLTALIDSKNHAPVIEALLVQNAPPAYVTAHQDDRSRYLQRLWKAGQHEASFALWRRFDPKAAKSVLFDGNFEGRTSLKPFGWTLLADPYSYAEIASSGEPGEGILHMRHDGSARSVLAQQIVALTTGGWTVSLDVRSGAESPEVTMALELVCTGSGRVLGSAPLQSKSTAWQRFDVSFAVAGCALQQLQLVGGLSADGSGALEARRMGVRKS